MKIAVLSANLGNFERVVEHSKQNINCDFFCFTDANFPPRYNSMLPRLQARIPKMFGWQMRAGYDIYIWVDSSCALLHENSVTWLLEQLGDADLAFLKHPNRNSIQEEADYLEKRFAKKCPYITPRYKNELLWEQLEEIKNDPHFVDNQLFASTVMVYRNFYRVQCMLKEWWYHTSRYHSIDQLSLPYVLAKSGCTYNVIPVSYFKTPYITYVRK